MNNISLLPPEIKAEQRLRRQLRIYILCSCLVILVFLGIYGGLIYLTNQEVAEASRLQEQKAEITRRAAVYQKYGELKEKVDALEKINADASGVTPNWYYFLAEVGSHIPDRVWLTDYTAAYMPEKNKKSKEKNAEGDKSQEDNSAALQGDLTICGKAFSHKDVAILLENLHDVQGLDDIRCQFSSEEKLDDNQKIYEFEIKASLPLQKGGK